MSVKVVNIMKKKMPMDNECKYLKIEDVTSYHEDTFDHLGYKYYCIEKNKDLPFGIFNCHKCKYYEKRPTSD